MMNKPKVGFIGQGFVGKNMATDFIERGYEVVRYSLEPEYIGNKGKIAECDVVFIAVPTPTKKVGFDDSILRDQIKLVGKGKIVVIKSTIIPKTTELVQKENPGIVVLHSPEFLRETTAKEDTKHPERNLIGIPVDSPEYREKAQFILSILPNAPYTKVLLSRQTELIKYIGNNFLYTKLIFMNIMYDLSEKMGVDWGDISEAVSFDSRIGKSHMTPSHASGISNQVGRGAGGHCFIKDFEALLQVYEKEVGDKCGSRLLEALRDKNIDLLTNSGKDLDILEGVYGK